MVKYAAGGIIAILVLGLASLSYAENFQEVQPTAFSKTLVQADKNSDISPQVDLKKIHVMMDILPSLRLNEIQKKKANEMLVKYSVIFHDKKNPISEEEFLVTFEKMTAELKGIMTKDQKKKYEEAIND